jgi:hypothetical protein
MKQELQHTVGWVRNMSPVTYSLAVQHGQYMTSVTRNVRICCDTTKFRSHCISTEQSV